jgi:hypothetical protein
MPMRSSFGRPLARLVFALGAIMLMAGGAFACPICFSGFVVTTAQELESADQAVLAVRSPDEKQFRIVEVIKGTVAGRVIVEPVSRLSVAARESGKPLLLLRNEMSQQWWAAGSIGMQYAGWLRQLAKQDGTGRGRAAWPRAGQPSLEMTDAGWRERVRLALSQLESPEPLAAEIAYGEISRAPYSALRSAKSQLAAMNIAQWMDDPKLASRRSTYTLLLGIAGGEDDAARLEQRIDEAAKGHDATNLAAMLAADLELRGPARVGWIEQMYFADRTRTLPEIEAARLALSVHGGANGTVPRVRVIQAFLHFIQDRPAMAAFVAQELADWEYWDATRDYVALLEADAVKDPAAHFAVVNYLQRSPHAAAKAALLSLAGQAK